MRRDAPSPPDSDLLVTIHLLGGAPLGLRVVQASHHWGSGLVVPRERYRDARRREEMERAGVYVLAGPFPEEERDGIYVGEGERVGKRLDDSAPSRDFWTTAFVFTGDQRLNKGHVKYMEGWLIARADKAKQCHVFNERRPDPPLGDADRPLADGFLEMMMLTLPTVGLRAFELRPQQAQTEPGFTCTGREASARGRPSDGGFVVLAGSRACAAWAPAAPDYLRANRAALERAGVLRPEGESLVFTQDYRFNSPSGAASAVLARNANGRTEWKDSQERSLKDIETRDLGQP